MYFAVGCCPSILARLKFVNSVAFYLKIVLSTYCSNNIMTLLKRRIEKSDSEALCKNPRFNFLLFVGNKLNGKVTRIIICEKMQLQDRIYF